MEQESDASTAVRWALASGEPVRALAIALEAWRQCRAPAVADVVDRLDLETRPLYRGYLGTHTEHFQRAWLALARGNPGTLERGWLARTLTDRLPRLEHAALRERLQALEGQPPDPRMGAALAKLLREGAGIDGTRQEQARQHDARLDQLVQLGDVRQLALLDELMDDRWLDARFGRRELSQARARLADTAWAEPSDASGWASLLERPLGPADDGSGEALLAAICQAPDDDQARMVYADWLTERGDPRGEFITLQMGPERTERERVLLRAHQERWLGPALSGLLHNVEFERGFLAAASLERGSRGSAQQWERAAQAEELATLRILRRGRGTIAHLDAFLASPRTVNLREVDLPTERSLNKLLSSPHSDARRMHRINLAFETSGGLLARMSQAPCLRELACLAYPVMNFVPEFLFEELEGATLPPSVHTLALHVNMDPGTRWGRMLARFRTVALLDGRSVFTVSAVEGGARLEVPDGSASPPLVVWILRNLRYALTRDARVVVRGLPAHEAARMKRMKFEIEAA